MEGFGRYMRHPRSFELGVAVVAALLAGLVVGKVGAAAVGLLAAVIAFAMLASANRGVVVGLIVLGIENGLPVIDVSKYSLGSAASLVNVLVAVLIAVLAVPLLLGRVHGPVDRVLLRRLLILTGALAGWWLITFVRTGLNGIPWLVALNIGRDFLVLTILLPLTYLSLRERRMVLGFLGTLVAGAVVYALGQVMTTVFGVQVPWLVHSVAVVSDEGVARVYASMAEIVHVVFGLSLGVVLLHRSSRWRIAGGAVAAICLVSLFAELGRAVYLGMLAGLVLVSLYWFVRVGPDPFRKQAARLVAGVAVIGVAAALVVPSVTSSRIVQTASSRVQAGFTETSSQTGNVGLRFTLYRDMLQIAGTQTPIGLGFLDPRYKYFVDLPLGDIRNSDVGVMNAVMTMGLVGAGLIYLLVAACIGRLLSAAGGRRRSERGDEWLAFGFAVWLVAAVVTSLTLVSLFGLGGLVVLGTVGAVALHATPEIVPARARARAGAGSAAGAVAS